MKRVCIHQPDFLPYLGFFHRLLQTDVFIIYDDAQFLRKDGWHRRDQIKTKKGAAWLTLSVKKNAVEQKINEVLLDVKSDYIEKNLNLIAENYGKTPFFSQFFPDIKAIYQKNFIKMIDLNMAFMYFFFRILEIDLPVKFSSALQATGKSTEKLVNLVKIMEGTHYLSGTGAKAYLDEKLFVKSGIIVEWQNFTHPIYPQLHGDFVPYLSILDILFNCGEDIKNIIRKC